VHVTLEACIFEQNLGVFRLHKFDILWL